MNGVFAHVGLRGVIGLRRALVKLNPRNVSFGLSVMGAEFFLIIRSASLAQARAGVPTDFRADPAAAARALMEMLFGFFDGDGEGVIVGFAADRALNVICAVARVGKNSAEDVPGGAQ